MIELQKHFIITFPANLAPSTSHNISALDDTGSKGSLMTVLGSCGGCSLMARSPWSSSVKGFCWPFVWTKKWGEFEREKCSQLNIVTFANSWWLWWCYSNNDIICVSYNAAQLCQLNLYWWNLNQILTHPPLWTAVYINIQACHLLNINRL